MVIRAHPLVKVYAKQNTLCKLHEQDCTFVILTVILNSIKLEMDDKYQSPKSQKFKQEIEMAIWVLTL